MPTWIPIRTYLIEASYKTKRGNLKKNFFEVKNTNEENAKTMFYLQIAIHNENFPKKPYLECKILSCNQIEEGRFLMNAKGSLSYQSL